MSFPGRRPARAAGPAAAPGPNMTSRSQAPPTGARLAVLLVLNLAVALGLSLLAWGDARGFVAHPARVAALLLLLAPTVVTMTSTSGWSFGVRHAGEARALRIALATVVNLGFFLVIFCEGHGIGVLPGGDALRWAGLAVLAAGVVIRAGPMLALGRRFTLQVAVTEGHRLETRGWYARVRHPSYLGVMLMVLGLVGVFRSAPALLLFAFTVWALLRRMAIEERFLAQEFGDEYRSYMVRTARLVPGVY